MVRASEFKVEKVKEERLKNPKERAEITRYITRTQNWLLKAPMPTLVKKNLKYDKDIKLINEIEKARTEILNKIIQLRKNLEKE